MNTPSHRLNSNVAALYAEPDSSSEQISQLVWGTGVVELERDGDFIRIIGEDLYKGWIRTSQIVSAADEQESRTSTVATLFAEVYNEPDTHSEILTRLTVGCRLALSNQSFLNRFVAVTLPLGGTAFVHETQVSSTYELPSLGLENELALPVVNQRAIVESIVERVVQASRLFVGIPYLWGGTTPFGLDCSGFTQLLYKINGLQLLRDSSQQWRDKRFMTVDCRNGLESHNIIGGDLLFFGRDYATNVRITHVALALGDGRFVHSVGKGRGNIISLYSDPEFTATFVGAKRIDPDRQLSIENA